MAWYKVKGEIENANIEANVCYKSVKDARYSKPIIKVSDVIIRAHIGIAVFNIQIEKSDIEADYAEIIYAQDQQMLEDSRDDC